eukprot:39995-Chlamydomonas_euryale.AAC.1
MTCRVRPVHATRRAQRMAQRPPLQRHVRQIHATPFSNASPSTSCSSHIPHRDGRAEWSSAYPCSAHTTRSSGNFTGCEGRHRLKAGIHRG